MLLMHLKVDAVTRLRSGLLSERYNVDPELLFGHGQYRLGGFSVAAFACV